MNVRRARAVDLHAGRALCLLLSMVEAVRSLLPRSDGPEPKRVLFIGLSELGAAILAQPALERVRERYPEAWFYYWIFEENAPVLHLMGTVPPENILVMRSRSVLSVAMDAVRGLLRLRRAGVDVVIDLELFSRFSAILSYLSGARRRAGFHGFRMEGLYRGELHTHRVLYNPYAPIGENYLALAEALEAPAGQVPMLKVPLEGSARAAPGGPICPGDGGKRKGPAVPRVPPLDGERESLVRKCGALREAFGGGRRIVALHMDLRSRIPIRNWPMADYVRLIERLLEREDLLVVLVGGGGPVPLPAVPGAYGVPGGGPEDEAPRVSHERCVDLVGRTTVAELVGLLQAADVLVSHDSGVVHMAALSGVHIVAMFGPETPVLYGPVTERRTVIFKRFACSPCLSAYNHRDSPCNDNQCMQAITVDEVYEAVSRAMRAP